MILKLIYNAKKQSEKAIVSGQAVQRQKYINSAMLINEL